MKTSLISKINKPLLVVVFVSLFAIMATKAYFTASADSPDNVFLSGTIGLSINQDSVLSVSDWMPGEEHTLEFDLQNTGSVPVFVKGYLNGEWSEAELDPSVFEIVSVDLLYDGTWVPIFQDGLNLGEEFYIGADGTVNTITMLNPQEIVSYRFTTRLNNLVSDEYQNKTLTANLHMAAKQVAQGSDWPSTY